MQSFGISGSGASRRRHYSTIIVLDEIDMLMTRDQAVRAALCSCRHASMLVTGAVPQHCMPVKILLLSIPCR
jgi:hypothetical protein